MPLVSTSKKPKGEIWAYYSPTNGNVNQFVCNFCKSATFYRNATRMKHHLCNCLKCPKELLQKFKKINTSWNASATLSSSPTPTNKSDQSTSETTTSTSIDNIYNSDEEDGNLIYRETGSHNLPKTVEEEVIVSQSTPKKIYQPLLKGFIDKMTNTEQVNYLFSSFSLFFNSINVFLI